MCQTAVPRPDERISSGSGARLLAVVRRRGRVCNGNSSQTKAYAQQSDTSGKQTRVQAKSQPQGCDGCDDPSARVLPSCPPGALMPPPIKYTQSPSLPTNRPLFVSYSHQITTYTTKPLLSPLLRHNPPTSILHSLSHPLHRLSTRYPANNLHHGKASLQNSPRRDLA